MCRTNWREIQGATGEILKALAEEEESDADGNEDFDIEEMEEVWTVINVRKTVANAEFNWYFYIPVSIKYRIST